MREGLGEDKEDLGACPYHNYLSPLHIARILIRLISSHFHPRNVLKEHGALGFGMIPVGIDVTKPPKQIQAAIDLFNQLSLTMGTM